MQTSGNLKSGDSSFYITPSPPSNSDLRPPLPYAQFDAVPNWLRTLYEVLHEVQTIAIRFYDCNDEITLCQ